MQEKETPALVFSREIYQIFKNSYIEEHLQATAHSDTTSNLHNIFLQFVSNVTFLHPRKTSEILVDFQGIEI